VCLRVRSGRRRRFSRRDLTAHPLLFTPARLFLVYGINDVLHGCLKKRPEGSKQIVDPMSAKAMPYIMRMLAIFGKQGLGGEDREKVAKMTKLWAERGIYTQNECVLLDACLATGAGGSASTRPCTCQ
jgi:hypothetical protein